MTTQSQASAVPLRKPRKPMPPRLKFYLAVTLIYCAFLAQHVYDFVIGQADSWDYIAGTIDVFMICWFWPFLCAEWKSWRDQ